MNMEEVIWSLKDQKRKYEYHGVWNNETIVSELEQIIKALGHFPSRSELKDMNRSDLKNAMDRRGGFNPFRIKLNCEESNRNKIKKCACGKQLKNERGKRCSLCSIHYNSIVRTLTGSKMSEEELNVLTLEKTQSFRKRVLEMGTEL